MLRFNDDEQWDTGCDAKVLGIQPTCECESFYLGASEPFEGSACIVDFARIAQSAEQNGGITLVGPPPF